MKFRISSSISGKKEKGCIESADQMRNNVILKMVSTNLGTWDVFPFVYFFFKFNSTVFCRFLCKSFATYLTYSYFNLLDAVIKKMASE